MIGYQKQSQLSFQQAVLRIRAELTKEGFGIITEIDVAATFKQKLGMDFENYIILGACHPPSAYKVLSARKDAGLLLPCNIIVYTQDGKTIIAVVEPTKTMTVLQEDSPEFVSMAREIESKLKKAVDSI